MLKTFQYYFGGRYLKAYQKSVRLNLFGENDSYKILGSNLALFIYSFAVLLILSYLYVLISEMLLMNRDSYKTIIDINSFDPEYNDLNMAHHNFMPFFEIRFLKTLPEEFDIYDNSVSLEGEEADNVGWDVFIPIDYSKLSRYI